jgi:DNA-directed RNA polymerase specialized sigma24 family protein
MSQPTDLSLLMECRGGDPDAFGQFYVRYRELIIGYLMRRVRDPELAADLMGETFAAALSQRWTRAGRCPMSRLRGCSPWRATCWLTAPVAARLQCSEALVRKRVSRAKAHLRTALGGFRA